MAKEDFRKLYEVEREDGNGIFIRGFVIYRAGGDLIVDFFHCHGQHAISSPASKFFAAHHHDRRTCKSFQTRNLVHVSLRPSPNEAYGWYPGIVVFFEKQSRIAKMPFQQLFAIAEVTLSAAETRAVAMSPDHVCGLLPGQGQLERMKVLGRVRTFYDSPAIGVHALHETSWILGDNGERSGDQVSEDYPYLLDVPNALRLAIFGRLDRRQQNSVSKACTQFRSQMLSPAVVRKAVVPFDMNKNPGSVLDLTRSVLLYLGPQSKRLIFHSDSPCSSECYSVGSGDESKPPSEEYFPLSTIVRPLAYSKVRLEKLVVSGGRLLFKNTVMRDDDSTLVAPSVTK